MRSKWGPSLFLDTIPAVAMEHMLGVGGVLWVPNVPYFRDLMAKHMRFLSQFYRVHKVHRHQLFLNPLYRATDFVEAQLTLLCETLTNENKIKSCLQGTDFPYFALVINEPYASGHVVDDNIQLNHLGEEGAGQVEDGDDDEVAHIFLPPPAMYNVKVDEGNREIVYIDMDDE